MENTEKVHYIPKDALIPVKVGAGFIQRMQKVLIFMLQDKTPEELENFKKLVETDAVPVDSWMDHYITIQTFVAIVEQTAFDEKLVVEKEL